MLEKIAIFRTPEIEVEYDAAYTEALKLWPVPYDEFYISTCFGDTHIVASGPRDAPPLLLFHPAGCGAPIWCRNVAALSQRYRTIAVDVMGEVNKSVPTRKIDSRQELADWVMDLFNGLKIDKACMVGNSFGGFLTFNTVLLQPDLVQKAVLISPAATFAQMWPWWWYFFPAYGTGSNVLKRRAYVWIWQDFPVDEPIARLRKISSLGGTPHHIPPTIFTDDELRQVRTPILLLIGDHEVVYKPEPVIQRAARLVPNLKAEIVPHANHNAQYTAPDFINAKILEFLGKRGSF